MNETSRIFRNIKVPMRDGIRLATTVHLPLEAGPFPVVLIRNAYNRVPFYDPFFPQHGMALVIQDTRGRYDSEGDYDPFVNEADDGFDTLEWIGRQPWCNGSVGMFGDSYLAATQFYAAQTRHPLLKALVPRFMAGDCWKRAYYCDGAFSLALTWSWLCFECVARTSEALMMPRFDVAKLLRKLPIISLDEASGAGVARHYRNYVTHSTYDSLWEVLNIRKDLGRYTMPVFLIGGWYDNYAAENIANFMALRENASTPELRDSHRMLIGPWTHGINWTSTLGDVDFGPDSTSQNDATYRWLDCLLHGGSPSQVQAAPIKIFVMGLNQWRDEQEWPPKRTRYVPCYLHARGALDLQPPTGDESPDRYVYDPADPVPTIGGNHSVGPYNPGLYDFVKPGPLDQRPIESRPDVLVYTTDVLAEDVEVTGAVVLHLFASSSARDTDFIAKLTDVYPDGRSINITEGVIRARFRDNVWGKPKLMTPGEVYKFAIDMQVTSNLFKKGHRIRVTVMSSNFPLWDRNLNTGNDPGTDTEIRTATQSIHHDRARPSHIVLPIVAGQIS